MTATLRLCDPYDAIGNPLNDGVWSYTWGAGRQLRSMAAEGTAVSFKYDHNGLRTQKVVQQDWYPVTTDYSLHGKLITHMNVHYTGANEIQQNDELYFLYDSQLRPEFVDYNGVRYAYVLNSQGDIVGLLDSAGALVVEYKCDAWSRKRSVTAQSSRITTFECPTNTLASASGFLFKED